ncbi:MAG: glycosyltransferase [Deltaproteobacteria bacterium]|nr:glycosyltransferase [Deltaproteobacteria bacterium]
MKIALVTPHFPPEICGVGDHSFKLANALSSLGSEISVWTTQARPVATDYPVHQMSRPWSTASFGQVNEGLAGFKPDVVLLQYTPYLYSESGGPLTLLLPVWISWLRARLGVRVGVIAHELHYPVNLSLAGVFRGVPQLQAFSGIALAANEVFFTYETAVRRYQKLTPWLAGSFHWLPVGANVEPVATVPKRAEIPAGHKILLNFGGAHPTQLLPWTFEALEHALACPKLKGKVTLVFVGNSRAKIESELTAAGKMALKANIRAVGRVSATEASQWLSRSDVVLAPLMDGVCTRRGSVIAALAHAKPVVTTTGYHTDRSLDWSKACAVVPADHSVKFAEVVLQQLLSEKKRNALGKAGHVFYEKNLTWEIIAEKLLEKLNS